MKIRILIPFLFVILATEVLFAAPRKTNRARPSRTAAVAVTALVSDNTLADTNLMAVGFSPGNAEQIVLSVIKGARREICVCAYAFSSRKIIQALEDAKKRGVDVKVLVEVPRTGKQRDSLKKAFAKNQLSHRYNRPENPILHHKFIVADRQIVQVGSFNYTQAAAMHNAENVVVLRGNAVARRYFAEWNLLWDKALRR
ncbi:MAG: phospholipase D-like domain-containing protein [Puniceicoccales bacterium]|jgi:phosphatidylserine/phosphatidylglycerophosphate/cardiolipin synthase-like enzyme|nr:phospholipase D-like domain-containing protein [Puniceicoccales bacterium]